MRANLLILLRVTTPLVRERSRVQSSPAAPVTRGGRGHPVTINAGNSTRQRNDHRGGFYEWQVLLRSQRVDRVPVLRSWRVGRGITENSVHCHFVGPRGA